MKKVLFILIIFINQHLAFAQNNLDQQPYLEVNSKADTLIVPDQIFISINLSEADSKNKISLEEQEQKLKSVLRNLKIDLKKDLSLVDGGNSYRSYFLKGQKVIKSKNFSLMVHSANMVSNVLAGLESAGIANAYVYKADYSQKEQLLLSLKSEAVMKAKKTAEALVKPLGQSIGKVFYIGDLFYDNYSVPTRYSMMLKTDSIGAGSSDESPLPIEFQKLKFQVQVQVRFQLH